MSTDVTEPVAPETDRPEPAPETRRQRRRAMLSRADLKVSPYAYVAPFFVLFAIFGLYPLVYTAWVSLHDWPLASEEHPFVGLANYRRLFTDPVFWNALWNTAGMFLLSDLASGITGEILHVDCGYNVMGSPGRAMDPARK